MILWNQGYKKPNLVITVCLLQVDIDTSDKKNLSRPYLEDSNSITGDKENHKPMNGEIER